ncbi:hypothetical protein N7495_004099 [Penicillium taxi]|uniref:uncharacterized protein n=1 Tax=Penicillium taxi TaxID=168475 RepID=UPI002545549A|nr:uncharacterized protein N7495_004099 [Penicillium taxi]KAJ5899355.1 hypothetical protein N7495_004099 [Penicillium taxi]
MYYNFQDHVKGIEQHLGPESPFSKQVALLDNAHKALTGKLETFEPGVGRLDTSIKDLRVTETDLVEYLKEIGQKLNASQFPPSRPVLEMELAGKFAENTQLQLQLHESTSKTDHLQKEVLEMKTVIEELQQLNKGTIARLQAAHELTMSLEDEKAAFSCELKMAEEKFQKEVDEKNMALTQLKAQHEIQLKNLRAEQDERRIALKSELKAQNEIQLNSLRNEKEEKNIALTQLKVQYEAQLNSLRKEKYDLEKASEGFIPRLQKIQKSLKEEQIQGLRESYTESMTRLEAQKTEIQHYQDLETAFRIETTNLKEQNEKFQESVCDLEQKLAGKVEIASARKDPIQEIVPFAMIQSQLPAQQPTSPDGDPSDFAMLFMSDEMFSSTPFNGGNSNKYQPTDLGEATNDIQKQEGTMDDPVTPVENSRPQSKRRCNEVIPVNFEGSQPAKKMKKKKEIDTKPDFPQGPGSEELTVSHVQKRTYSRIHSTATQVQSTAPIERRTSPKGLISASSASQVQSRPNTRARGRRRSRGMSDRTWILGSKRWCSILMIYRRSI